MAKASLAKKGVIRETSGNPGVTTLKRVDVIASPRSSISPFETKSAEVSLFWQCNGKGVVGGEGRGDS